MTLEEELNKIASEIKALEKVITPPFNVVTRMDKIKLGMSMLEHQKLVFTFNRMLPLANTSLLSEESKELTKTPNDHFSKTMEFITKDPPEEVKKFLDNA